MRWLSEGVGFFYGLTSWNKFIRAKWQFVKFFQLYEFVLYIIYKFAISVILENKTNAPSHPNIGSLKTAIEEEWNKMSEEFILNACKSFPKHVDTIIEKKGRYIE